MKTLIKHNIALYSLQFKDQIQRALEEDLGVAGDVTSQAVVPAGKIASGRILARESGTIAGLEVAAQVFRLLDPTFEVKLEAADGDAVEAGRTLLSLKGSAATLLTGERTALNFLGRMCGVATQTARACREVEGTRARVVATRKTIPGMRLLDKYAVRCGGGSPHRFGLDDGILIKDNHVALAGGVVEAVLSAVAFAGHMLKVEIEVDTLDQLRLLLRHADQNPQFKLDVVMLDNFNPVQLREAIDLVKGRWALEASGGITLANLRSIAETGVDLISLGSLTHSVKVLDVALDVDSNPSSL
jgi:nicotinate-nucleotide pyrophosphorylase (carboxylating)